MNKDWPCSYCGDVIGVYEPVIVVDRDGERRASRLNGLSDADEQDALYHVACRHLAAAEGS
jgi:hypothetical protein